MWILLLLQAPQCNQKGLPGHEHHLLHCNNSVVKLTISITSINVNWFSECPLKKVMASSVVVVKPVFSKQTWHDYVPFAKYKSYFSSEPYGMKMHEHLSPIKGLCYRRD